MAGVASDFPWCGITADFRKGLQILKEGEAGYDSVKEATINDLRPVLLNDNLMYPKVFYKILTNVGMNRDRKRWKRWRHDLLLMSLGVAGVEYVKTDGWRYVKGSKELPVIVETVLGSVTLLVQKRSVSFKVCGILAEEQRFCVEEVVTIRVPRGRKVVVPPGYDLVFVNNSLNPAAVSIALEEGGEMIPSDFIESKGAAYYVIKKNARQELVPNPRYRPPPKLKKIKAELVWERVFHEAINDLLYQFLCEQQELLNRLNNFDWDRLFC